MLQLCIRRAIAFTIDLLIIALVFYGNIQVILYATRGSIGGVSEMSLGELLLANSLQIIYLFIYFIYIPIRQEGQTIGKQLLSLKQVNLDQTPLSIQQYFKRDILLKFLLTTLTGGAMILINAILMCYQVIRHQPVECIHDKIMNTTVIKLK